MGEKQPRFAALLGAASLLLIGCGGSRRALKVPDVASGSPPRSEPASARFFVNVVTRQVTIEPLTQSANLGGRAILTGTSVSFESSELLDLPGNPGVKAIRVSLTNRLGVPIGQLPDGTSTGVRVFFGPITNVGSFSDLRPLVGVSTAAGTGTASSVDGPVGSATFNFPIGIAVDSRGNVYVSEFNGRRIRKIAGGFVSTLAGSGAAVSSDGAGTGSSFYAPAGIAINPVDGALIVAEYGAHKIRRVTMDGRVTTIAGTGASGDTDGPGDLATFRNPLGVAVDSAGVIYVTEWSGHRVRKIQLTGADPRQATSYTVTTLAGSPTAASGFVDGVGTNARFTNPAGITVGADGNLYVAAAGNNRVRRVSLTGEVVTIAGTGSAGTTDGSGEVATLYNPYGIVAIGEALVVTDRLGHTVRQIRKKQGASSSGSATSYLVQSIAGLGGTSGNADGNGTDARFDQPRLIAADISGQLYVADYNNHRIRQITPTNGFFPLGLATSSAPTEAVQLSNADGVSPVAAGSPRPFIIYNEAIRPGASSTARVWLFIVPDGVTAFEFTVVVEAHPSSGAPVEGIAGPTGSPSVLVSTLVGSAGDAGGYVDGVGTASRFSGIYGLSADASGNLYVADTGNHAIRRITPTGVTTTVAGSVGVSQSGMADGVGTVARFNGPTGIAVAPDGRTLFIADSANRLVRRASLTGLDRANPASWTVTTVAGTGTPDPSNPDKDGTGDQGTLASIYGIAIDPTGNLYVTTDTTHRVRRIQFKGGNPTLASSWQVSTLLKNPDPPDPPVLSEPRGIATDREGNVYVANSGSGQIIKITPDGAASVLASGLTDPRSVAVDSAGYVYVAEAGTHLIKRVSPSGAVTTVAGSGIAGFVDGRGDQAQLNNPVAIAVDRGGSVFVADGPSGGRRVVTIQRIIQSAGR